MEEFNRGETASWIIEVDNNVFYFVVNISHCVLGTAERKKRVHKGNIGEYYSSKQFYHWLVSLGVKGSDQTRICGLLVMP